MSSTAEDLKPLWEKVDAAHGRIQKVELDHAETKGQVNLLAQDLHHIKLTMAEHRTESKTGMDRLQTGLDTLNSGISAINIEQAKQTGAGMSRREMFAWAGTAVGILGGLIAIANWIS